MKTFKKYKYLNYLIFLNYLNFLNFSNILELAQGEPRKLFLFFLFFFKNFWRPPDISIELTKYKYLNYLSFFFFFFFKKYCFFYISWNWPRENPGNFFLEASRLFFFELLKLFDFFIFLNILELAQRELGKLFIFFNLKFLEASRLFLKHI